MLCLNLSIATTNFKFTKNYIAFFNISHIWALLVSLYQQENKQQKRGGFINTAVVTLINLLTFNLLHFPSVTN